MTDEPSVRRRELIVTTAAQERFARLSGDHNPLHVDPVRARRSTFGAPVVHGVHLVLQLLAVASTPAGRGSPGRLLELDAEFRRHIPVGAPFSADVRSRSVPASDESTRTWIGELRRGSMRCARVTWRTGPVDAGPSSRLAARVLDPIPLAGIGSPPCEADEALRLDPEELDALLPGLGATIEATDVAALLATTRLVGMRCPGDDALLRRIHLEYDIGASVPDDALRPRIVRRDRRLSLLVLELRGAQRRMAVEVIERPPPATQAPMSEVRALVGSDRFRAVRVAVIGGSRGLGEVAVRLLTAGGATCLVTSRFGEAELGALVDTLGVTPLVLDVTAPDPDAVAALRRFAPTHLAYFAAPPLSPIAADDIHGGTALAAVLEHGLHDVLDVILPEPALKGVLVPSTVFVDGAPSGLEQYAAVKQRVEQSMDALRQRRPGLRIVVPRFPPLLTDQTVGSAVEGPERTLRVLLAALEQWIPSPRLQLTAPQAQHDDGLRSLAARTLGRDPYQASRHHLHWLWRCAPDEQGREDSFVAVRDEQVVAMVHRLRMPWHTADGSTIGVPAIVDLAVDPSEPPSTALALLRTATKGEACAYVPASRGLASGLERMGAVQVAASWWRRALVPHPRGLRWDGGGRDPMRLRDRVDALHGSERRGLHVTTRPDRAELDSLAALLSRETATAFTAQLVGWRLFHRYGPPSAWLHQAGACDEDRADLIVAFGVRRHLPFVRLITALGTPQALSRALKALVRSSAEWGAAALLATVPPDLDPVMRSAGLRELRDAPSAWLLGADRLGGSVRYDGLLGDLGLDGVPRERRAHRGASG